MAQQRHLAAFAEAAADLLALGGAALDGVGGCGQVGEEGLEVGEGDAGLGAGGEDAGLDLAEAGEGAVAVAGCAAGPGCDRPRSPRPGGSARA